MRKACVLLCLISGFLLSSNHSHGQGLFTWNTTGLMMHLPYDTALADIMNEEDELRISWSELELRFLSVSRDSVELYFSDRYLEILMGIVSELELIPLSTPQKFASTPDGLWFTAIDTAVFTDTVLLGAISWPGSDLVVIALFDCYGSPLEKASAIMKSLAFVQNHRKRE